MNQEEPVKKSNLKLYAMAHKFNKDKFSNSKITESKYLTRCLQILDNLQMEAGFTDDMTETDTPIKEMKGIVCPHCNTLNFGAWHDCYACHQLLRGD